MPKKMSFKKGTRAAAKREEIATAMHRENPGIAMDKKMAIATSAAKKALKCKGRKFAHGREI